MKPKNDDDLPNHESHSRFPQNITLGLAALLVLGALLFTAQQKLGQSPIEYFKRLLQTQLVTPNALLSTRLRGIWLLEQTAPANDYALSTNEPSSTLPKNNITLSVIALLALGALIAAAKQELAKSAIEGFKSLFQTQPPKPSALLPIRLEGAWLSVQAGQANLTLDCPHNKGWLTFNDEAFELVFRSPSGDNFNIDITSAATGASISEEGAQLRRLPNNRLAIVATRKDKNSTPINLEFLRPR